MTKIRGRPRNGETAEATVPPGGATAAPAQAEDEDLRESLRAMTARCAQIETENKRLKLLVAELLLRNEALKHVVAKES